VKFEVKRAAEAGAQGNVRTGCVRRRCPRRLARILAQGAEDKERIPRLYDSLFQSYFVAREQSTPGHKIPDIFGNEAAFSKTRRLYFIFKVAMNIEIRTLRIDEH